MHEHTASSSRGGRPELEVADIFRAHGERYREARPLSMEQWRVMRDIEACRTATLGGHLDVCNACGYNRPAYNSCRNRHCPKCQGLEQARWIEGRKARVLPVRHFHVVFTLPETLRPLAMVNRRVVFNILFETAAQTLLEFGRDERWLGGQIGITQVLHTWTRDLQFHPHVHCVVTDGGLSRDGTRWSPGKGKGKFLFPVRALSKVFRAKFVAALVRARERGELRFAGGCQHLTIEDAFADFKDELFRHNWVVYAKRPFRGAHFVFEYLGRYTHRVGISNHRLLDMEDDHVRFRTKDHKTVRVHAHEFIRRFLLHVLPVGFVKKRHYGLYASSNVETRLRTARLLLEDPADDLPQLDAAGDISEPTDWRDELAALTGVDIRRCPKCRIGVLREEPLPMSRADRTPDPAPPPT